MARLFLFVCLGGGGEKNKTAKKKNKGVCGRFLEEGGGGKENENSRRKGIACVGRRWWWWWWEGGEGERKMGEQGRRRKKLLPSPTPHTHYPFLSLVFFCSFASLFFLLCFFAQLPLLLLSHSPPLLPSPYFFYLAKICQPVVSSPKMRDECHSVGGGGERGRCGGYGCDGWVPTWSRWRGG